MRERAAGVLLHPTSLSGRFAAGDLGPGAHRFAAWLADAGLGLWQMLPLGPPGGEGSPYDARSLFAGSPALVSPEALADAGLLDPAELAAEERSAAGAADPIAAGDLRHRLLRRAHARLDAAGRDELATFRDDSRRRRWLDDWTLYAALRERYGGSWTSWPRELQRRERPVLRAARRELAAELEYQAFVQLCLERQCRALRAACRRQGVVLVGDLPVYPGLDSADVWARPELFDLDAEGHPRAVAGVPPDAFSERGQLWGHPLYAWDRHRDEGFAWWIARLESALERADVVRVDHFRGYHACWAVPAGAPDATGGAWRPGPGEELFRALAAAWGGEASAGDVPPLLAEDLGQIDAEVEALRRAAGLPGMRVLQFGFGDAASPHLPHRYPPEAAAYTGTHDNDTCRGWLAAATRDARERALDYLGAEEADFHRRAVHSVWTSPAAWALAPMQDLLGLGSEARMNAPGQARGNWAWRLQPGELEAAPAGWLRRLTEVAGRLRRAGGGPEAAAAQGAEPGAGGHR